MKIDLDQQYMKKIKYITLGFIIIYFIYAVIANLNLVVNTFSNWVTEILNILSPLIWGFIIAYLIYPLAVFFERQLLRIKIKSIKKPHNVIELKKTIRIISITLSFTIVFLVIFLLIYSAFVMIGGSFKEFSWSETREYIMRYLNKYYTQFGNIKDALSDMGVSQNILTFFDIFTENFYVGAQNLLAMIATQAGTIGKYLIDISFGFVFAVNLLYNRDYFSKFGDNILRLIFSSKNVEAIKSLLNEINIVLVNFIRAKIIDLTLLSFFTTFDLMIIKIDFPVFLGFFAGYTNIIPYLGTWIGIIPAVIIVLAQGDTERAIIVGAYIVIVQQIYIMLISPKVQGKGIGLHPFFVLLAIIVFGALFGLVGMIFAIPIAGVIKVLVLRWAKNKQQKKQIELYDLEDYRY